MVSPLPRPMTLPAWMTLLDVSPLFPELHYWIQGPFRHPHVSSLSRRHYCCCLLQLGRHPFRVKKPRSPLRRQHYWSLQGRFACFLSCAGLESNLLLHHLRKLKMELNNSTTIVLILQWNPAITKCHGTEKNVRYSEDPVITNYLVNSKKIRYSGVTKLNQAEQWYIHHAKQSTDLHMNSNI